MILAQFEKSKIRPDRLFLKNRQIECGSVLYTCNVKQTFTDFSRFFVIKIAICDSFSSYFEGNSCLNFRKRKLRLVFYDAFVYKVSG